MPTNRMSILCVQIINRRENMDVLLALNHIGIRIGLIEHKSSLRSATRRANVIFSVFPHIMVTYVKNESLTK